ncbi:MAG: EamA family transporter [Clostridia bacterium]|nr:EamA family transporter [Clostridia bacterium]
MIKFYLLVVFNAFASAVSQILLNVSARKAHRGKLYEYLNPWVIASYGILFCVLALNVFAERYIPLKVAHAIAAVTYLFVALLSRLVFKEKITRRKALGLLLIIGGIAVFMLESPYLVSGE